MNLLDIIDDVDALIDDLESEDSGTNLINLENYAKRLKDINHELLYIYRDDKGNDYDS